jgi:hypothetical protein
MRFFCDDFDGRFPSQNRKSAPTKKNKRENKHTQKMHKKSLSPTSKSPLSKVIKKKGARTLYAFLYQCFVLLDASHALYIAQETIRSTLFYKMRQCVRNDSFLA